MINANKAKQIAEKMHKLNFMLDAYKLYKKIKKEVKEAILEGRNSCEIMTITDRLNDKNYKYMLSKLKEKGYKITIKDCKHYMYYRTIIIDWSNKDNEC